MRFADQSVGGLLKLSSFALLRVRTVSRTGACDNSRSFTKGLEMSFVDRLILRDYS